MRYHTFTEDLFIDFLDTLERKYYSMQYQDRSAAHSFYDSIHQGKQFTEKQAQYVLKLLFKYRKAVADEIDYRDHMEMPQWKQPFRVVDMSKKVWIEEINKKHMIVLKFPFHFKTEFDEFIKEVRYDMDNENRWDGERKVRTLSLYGYNLVLLKEFLKVNDFEIDHEFNDVVERVEEIYWDVKEYSKLSKIIEGSVELKNASDSAKVYFRKHKTGKINSDLVLAKSMGHIFGGKNKNINSWNKKIASETGNQFWVKDLGDFLKLGYSVEGKIAIILDRTSEPYDWLSKFNEAVDKNNFDRNDFRICFRSSKHEGADFNDWVRDNGYGGKIEGAKFLIFNQKPAKWLFKDEKDVTILASNNLFAVGTSMMRNLFKNHPCVVYIGDIAPTIQEPLVEL